MLVLAETYGGTLKIRRGYLCVLSVKYVFWKKRGICKRKNNKRNKLSTQICPTVVGRSVSFHRSVAFLIVDGLQNNQVFPSREHTGLRFLDRTR